MDNNNILAIGLLGIGGLLLYLTYGRKSNNTSQFIPGQTQLAPQPNPNTHAQAWQQWVSVIVSLFGTASTLWQPGGPFHNSGLSESDVESIYISNGGNFDSDSPYFPKFIG